MSNDNNSELLRIAGLRLMGADDDARRLITFLDEGRVDLAKLMAVSLVKQIEETQKGMKVAR